MEFVQTHTHATLSLTRTHTHTQKKQKAKSLSAAWWSHADPVKHWGAWARIRRYEPVLANPPGEGLYPAGKAEPCSG